MSWFTNRLLISRMITDWIGLLLPSWLWIGKLFEFYFPVCLQELVVWLWLVVSAGLRASSPLSYTPLQQPCTQESSSLLKITRKMGWMERKGLFSWLIQNEATKRESLNMKVICSPRCHICREKISQESLWRTWKHWQCTRGTWELPTHPQPVDKPTSYHTQLSSEWRE